MQDASAVGRFERTGDLLRQRQSLLRAHRPGERAAFDILQDQVVRTHVINLADVRMVESGDRASFDLEPRPMFSSQTLDRHSPIQPRVAGLPHLSHAAFAKRRENLVWTDAHAWCKGHPADSIVRWPRRKNGEGRMGIGEPKASHERTTHNARRQHV